MAFWFVAVLICLNIVVAFALDAFHDAAGDAEAEGSDAPLEAIFDASQVTGTRTGLAGEYRAYASWAEQQHAAQLPSLQRLFAAQPTAEPG